jgi:hypothetical protein
MTNIRHATAIAPSLYLSEFRDSLEHPARIWDHAFRYQISEAARNLLLVLNTLPDQVLLSDLETAFWIFYRFRQSKFGFSTSSGDWDAALKQLDGNFVLTKRIGKDLVISFHNPSVRDYLEDFLSNSDNDVADLVKGAHFYEQYVILWTGKRGHKYGGIDRHQEGFTNGLQRNIFGPSVTIIRQVNRKGEPTGFTHWPESNENRVAFALRVSKEIKGQGGVSFLTPILVLLCHKRTQGLFF